MSGEGMNNQSGINLKIDAYMRANPAAVKGKSRQQIISIMLQNGQLTAAEVSQLSGMLSGEMADTADMGWTIERESLPSETNPTEKQTLPPAPQTQPATTIRIAPIPTENNPFSDGADIDAIMPDFPIMGDTFETSSTPTPSTPTPSTPTPATPVASPAQPEPQVAPESATAATTTPAPSEPAPTPVTEATPATEPQVAQEASTPAPAEPQVAPLPEEQQTPPSTLTERDGHIILERQNGETVDVNEVFSTRISQAGGTIKKASETPRYRGVTWDKDTITAITAQQQEELRLLEALPDNMERRAQLFKMMTGAEFTPENVEKFLNGEIKLKSEQRIEEYARDEKAREEALIPSWVRVGTTRQQIIDDKSYLGFAFSVADKNNDGVLGEDEMPRFREEVIRGKKAQEQRRRERERATKQSARQFYAAAANSTSGSRSTLGMKKALSNIDASTICDFLTAYNNIEVRKGDSSIIDTIFSEWGMNKAQRQEVMNIILNKLCEAAENVGVDPAEIKQAREAFASYDKKNIEDALHRLHGKTVALQSGNDILPESSEKAAADAREFYRIADDNAGIGSIPKMFRHMINNVTPDNICDFLDGYDSTNVRQQDSSVIDTIMSEVSCSPELKNLLLDSLMDKLTQAARNNGVAECDIEEARRAFSTHKKEDMECAMRLLRGSILAKKIPNPTELTAEQAISTFTGIARGDRDSAEGSFVGARIDEGWVAATGDTVCGWFGCTTVEEMEQKLGVHAAQIKALCECKTEADFRAKYKEIFGIDFDVEKIAARELAVSNYQQAQMLSRSLEKITEILIKYPNASLKDLKAHMQNNLGYDNTTIEKMYLEYAKAHGIELKTDEDKRNVLLQVLREAAQGAESAIAQLTDGKSFERMQTDIELLTKSAFGTQSDIVQDVMKFNENMMITEMVTLGIAEIAGTVALQFVPGLGQLMAARLAASAARFGTRAVKVANALEKTAALGVRMQSGQTFKGANGLAKAANRGVQVAGQMATAGTATAAVGLTNGDDAKEVLHKTLMNMSFAGVGATSSILSPKLMQMFKIDSRVATELSEEIMNIIGSCGVSRLSDLDYTEQDAVMDMIVGLVIARVSHVRGAGQAADAGQPPNAGQAADARHTPNTGHTSSTADTGFYSSATTTLPPEKLRPYQEAGIPINDDTTPLIEIGASVEELRLTQIARLNEGGMSAMYGQKRAFGHTITPEFIAKYYPENAVLIKLHEKGFTKEEIDFVFENGLHEKLLYRGILTRDDLSKDEIMAIAQLPDDEFSNVTSRLGRRLLNSSVSQRAVRNLGRNPIAGNLPPEFISVLKPTCTNNDEMREKVLAVYEAFDNLSTSIKGITPDLNEAVPEDQLAALADAFTLRLREIGLIGPYSSVSLKSLGGGSFGQAYTISFSNSNFSPKVLKLMTENDCRIEDTRLHGIVGETNTALYIKKHRGHNGDDSNVTEFYFSNIDSGFMLTENANNYAGPTEGTYQKLHMDGGDVRNDGNIVNGRVVDMGGFMYSHQYGRILELPYGAKILARLDRAKNAGGYKQLVKAYTELYTLAINNRCADADQVLKVLDEYRRAVPSDFPDDYVVPVRETPPAPATEPLADSTTGTSPDSATGPSPVAPRATHTEVREIPLHDTDANTTSVDRWTSEY